MMIQRRRPGFTLLEILLASVIAIIVLGALYAAMTMTMRRMDTTRDFINQANLSQALVNRLSADLSGTMGPLPPRSGGGTASQTSALPLSYVPIGTTETMTPEDDDSASTSSTSSSSDVNPFTNGGSTSSSSSSSSTTTATASATEDDSADDEESEFVADVPLQAGIVGTPQLLTIYSSRVTPSQSQATSSLDYELQPPSDQQRVTYYLADDGSGLCRQERPWVMADAVRNNVEPDYSTQYEDLIAPEVKNITFEYYVGGTWQAEWDGSVAALDGQSATGPPRAIRMIMTIELSLTGNRTREQIVEHVIPIRSAVGSYAPPLPEEEEATEEEPTS